MLEAAMTAAIRKESTLSFEDAVSLCQEQVLRTAYRILGNWADAEDAAQETFVRLHRHGFRFPTASARTSWLYRVTVNVCLDQVRKRRPSEELSDAPSGAVSAEVEAIRDEEARQLMAAMGRLPARERAAVVLREIEGLSTAEVARILGSGETTVRSQISRALVRLRGLLREEKR